MFLKETISNNQTFQQQLIAHFTKENNQRNSVNVNLEQIKLSCENNTLRKENEELKQYLFNLNNKLSNLEQHMNGELDEMKKENNELKEKIALLEDLEISQTKINNTVSAGFHAVDGFFRAAREMTSYLKNYINHSSTVFDNRTKSTHELLMLMVSRMEELKQDSKYLKKAVYVNQESINYLDKRLIEVEDFTMDEAVHFKKKSDLNMKLMTEELISQIITILKSKNSEEVIEILNQLKKCDI
ncbi:hypothetical protein ABK040_004626 [Willaertia magna]